MKKNFFISGAILAGLAVAMGTYGAHGGAKFMDAESAITFGKAVRYQMNHALALLVLSLAFSHLPNQKVLLSWAGYSFLGGILSFSGSLYLLVFAKLSLGYITPLGGVLFVLGWFLMAFGAFKSQRKEP
ncbi:MAG: DUF423 domain-containing protein [Bacteroidales bacterium]|nr:DUF423 domain-containing protein [Bacteroidales bacterium]